jgi:hypothetical protein
MYRETTGKNMSEAVDFVNKLTAQLKVKYPERFTSDIQAVDAPTSRSAITPKDKWVSQRPSSRWLLIISALALLLAGVLLGVMIKAHNSTPVSIASQPIVPK